MATRSPSLALGAGNLSLKLQVGVPFRNADAAKKSTQLEDQKRKARELHLRGAGSRSVVNMFFDSRKVIDSKRNSTLFRIIPPPWCHSSFKPSSKYALSPKTYIVLPKKQLKVQLLQKCVVQIKLRTSNPWPPQTPPPKKKNTAEARASEKRLPPVSGHEAAASARSRVPPAKMPRSCPEKIVNTLPIEWIGHKQQANCLLATGMVQTRKATEVHEFREWQPSDSKNRHSEPWQMRLPQSQPHALAAFTIFFLVCFAVGRVSNLFGVGLKGDTLPPTNTRTAKTRVKEHGDIPCVSRRMTKLIWGELKGQGAKQMF